MIAAILSGYLQQFLRVSDVLLLGVSWRHRCGWAVLLSCRPPCFQQYQLVLLCWCFPGDILLFRRGIFLGYFFQWLILTLIYYYIYIIHFCLVFFTRFGFLQLPHTYITIVSSFVLLDFVDMLLSLNLPCIILPSFTLKIFFPQDFSLLFETNCKNCKKYFM